MAMIGNRKLVVTTHMDLDNIPNVPMIYETPVISITDGWLPSNLSIGKTYYYLTEEDNLLAFKIHAYTFIKNKYRNGSSSTFLYGLIQTPTETSWRCDVFNGLIFESVEDYYTYLETGKGNVIINRQKFANPTFYLYKTYYWDKSSKRPELTYTDMWRILITDTHVYIEVDYRHWENGEDTNGFPSAEECIKHHIDGMKIVEFDEPKVVVNIHIEEPKTPKVRVLKFIDE